MLDTRKPAKNFETGPSGSGLGVGGVDVASATAERSTVRWRVALGMAFVVGIAVAIRAVLMLWDPIRPDMEVYARWAHQIAVGPISQAYTGDLNLPPVMVYIWAALAAVQPAFLTAIDASDLTIRVFLKAPASLADIGLVLAAMWSLRDRPRWALIGGLAVGLQPALFSDSAWWGQTDSLYILPAFIAFLFARAGRPIPAAIALAVSLMVKPQAMIFIIPFAAYALRRLDRRQLLVSVGALVATMALLWIPFISAGGPLNYLHAPSVSLEIGGLRRHHDRSVECLVARRTGHSQSLRGLDADRGSDQRAPDWIGGWWPRRDRRLCRHLASTDSAATGLGPRRRDTRGFLLPHDHARAILAGGSRLPRSPLAGSPDPSGSGSCSRSRSPRTSSSRNRGRWFHVSAC